MGSQTLRSTSLGEITGSGCPLAEAPRARRKTLGMDLDRLTSEIIGAAIAVRKELGPGLLESVYTKCLVLELQRMGHCVDTEVAVPVVFRGPHVQDEGFRMDLLVQEAVVVEVKSCQQLKDVFRKQLLTYLRLSGKTVGLLINFSEALLRDGIARIVNGFDESGRNVAVDQKKVDSSALSASRRENPVGKPSCGGPEGAEP
jgi:GxxExxY protein